MIKFDEKKLHVALRGTFTALSLFSLMLAGVYFKLEEDAQNQAMLASVIFAEHAVTPAALEARAAVVYDAKSGKVLFEKNANEPLPLASLTKLMSAEAILSIQNPDTTVTITKEDLAQEGDSGLKVGDIWSLKNLLTFGLIASSNDAMAAAAASAGTSSTLVRMNATAQALGLRGMSFSNPTGLDIDTSMAGAYGSAKDVAVFASLFLRNHPDLFGATVLPARGVASESGETKATPTAEPIFEIPGLIGAKTGYTDLAGGNLVAAFDVEIGHPVIAVVLGSSHDGRFADVRELIRATRDAAQ